MCLSVFKTKSLDGTLHNHGHRNAPCPGSNRLPLIIDADVLSSTGVINIPDSSADASFEDSTDSTHPLIKVTKLSLNPVAHPIYKGQLIKRIPKAARRCCADLLRSLLQDVVDNPDSSVKWTNLFNFGSSILRKPVRGGKSRNLSKTIMKRVTDLKDGKTNTDELCSFQQKPNKTDKVRNLANAVASKLEDGNFKAALRLICSDDTPALTTKILTRRC